LRIAAPPPKELPGPGAAMLGTAIVGVAVFTALIIQDVLGACRRPRRGRTVGDRDVALRVWPSSTSSPRRWSRATVPMWCRLSGVALRMTIAACFAAYLAVLAWSRVYLGMHHPHRCGVGRGERGGVRCDRVAVPAAAVHPVRL